MLKLSLVPAAPYRVLPLKTKPPRRKDPSLVLLVKLWRLLKPVPLVPRAKTVPPPPLPPVLVAPKIVLLNTIKPAAGLSVKLCRAVKPVPIVLSLNTVPPPEAPPEYVVPYRVLPDKIKLFGAFPSLLKPVLGSSDVKLCRFVKPEPSVLSLKTVPWPELPPEFAAPNSVSPNRTKPAAGPTPSAFVLQQEPLKGAAVKLCRFVKPVPSV